MFGMHGYFKAQPGQGQALADILLEAAEALRANESCLLYVVSRGEDDDTIWVTEAWTDREAHEGSLDDLAAKDQIARAMPLIAGIDGRAEFTPLGGKGLPAAG
jgi:quinol monooxygenase YgiN